MRQHKLFIIIFCLCGYMGIQETQAQDAVFSQFYNNPVYSNPAFAGVHNGRFRIVTAFKDQWNAVSNTKFTTSHLSIDMKEKIGKADFFTYGFSGTNDQTGNNNYTTNTAGYFAGYLKQLSGSSTGKVSQYLSASFNFNIGKVSIEPYNLWYSTQFDSQMIQVDRSIQSGEDFRDASKLFPDFSAGLLYYGVNGDNSYYLGLAAHHLNRPEIALNKATEFRRFRRYSVQAGGQIAISNSTQILPSVLFNSQGPSMSLAGGLNVRHSNEDWKDIAIRFGTYMSFAKNVNTGMYLPWITTTFNMEFNNVSLGLSYDLSLSSLGLAVDSRGALELTVSYAMPASFIVPIECPVL